MTCCMRTNERMPFMSGLRGGQQQPHLILQYLDDGVDVILIAREERVDQQRKQQRCTVPLRVYVYACMCIYVCSYVFVCMYI
jgi:hypothetical protein